MTILITSTLTKIRNNPANNYLFKVSNWNTGKRCKICSKLKIKTTERLLCWSPFFNKVAGTYFTPFSSVDFEQVNVSHETFSVPCVFELHWPWSNFCWTCPYCCLPPWVAIHNSISHSRLILCYSWNKFITYMFSGDI